MNKARRKRLVDASGLLGLAKDIFEEVRLEEQEYLDNIPENLTGSDRYSQSEDIIYNLEDGISSIEDIINSIEDV